MNFCIIFARWHRCFQTLLGTVSKLKRLNVSVIKLFPLGPLCIYHWVTWTMPPVDLQKISHMAKMHVRKVASIIFNILHVSMLYP